MGRASKRKLMDLKSGNKQQRRMPTAQMLKDWLFSTDVSNWVKTYIEIPEDFSYLLRQKLIDSQLKNMDSDCRVQYGHVVIGINALKWELWLSTPLCMADYPKNVFDEPVSPQSMR